MEYSAALISGYSLASGMPWFHLARRKRRSVVEGVLLGLTLGPFGAIALACLEQGDVPASMPKEPQPEETSDDKHDDEPAPMEDFEPQPANVMLSERWGKRRRS